MVPKQRRRWRLTGSREAERAPLTLTNRHPRIVDKINAHNRLTVQVDSPYSAQHELYVGFRLTIRRSEQFDKHGPVFPTEWSRPFGAIALETHLVLNSNYPELLPVVLTRN